MYIYNWNIIYITTAAQLFNTQETIKYYWFLLWIYFYQQFLFLLSTCKLFSAHNEIFGAFYKSCKKFSQKICPLSSQEFFTCFLYCPFCCNIPTCLYPTFCCNILGLKGPFSYEVFSVLVSNFYFEKIFVVVIEVIFV